jgi:hypothetical protein
MREPAVAGQFYAFDKEGLQKELKKSFAFSGEPKKSKNKNSILSAVCPHAGYMYSGGVAAYSYRALKEDRTAETFVIIGPNHGGVGPAVSVYPSGEWETPLGKIEIDSKLAQEIAGDKFTLDDSAHTFEHSAEVQLPFLQRVFKDFKIVPICVLDQRLDLMKELGERLAKVLDENRHVVIASTDFSHYIPNEDAYSRDFKAIEAIKSLDENALFEAIDKYDISMCGYGGVAATIVYSKFKGAKKGELLKYMTSGDVTGDKSAVVGYGSLILKKA